jgi:hypothetical protein
MESLARRIPGIHAFVVEDPKDPRFSRAYARMIDLRNDKRECSRCSTSRFAGDVGRELVGLWTLLGRPASISEV